MRPGVFEEALSTAQRSGTYGREAARYIGQREVLHTMQSKTSNPEKWLATTTTSQQVRIEPAVMASEICPRCGAEQDNRDLHTEPGEPFFEILHAAPGSIRLSHLAGQVRLSGDEHFTIG
ncbi:MAG: hypothetical protein ACRETZ_07695 [Steroidobacteraceae bacterium]